MATVQDRTPTLQPGCNVDTQCVDEELLAVTGMGEEETIFFSDVAIVMLAMFQLITPHLYTCIKLSKDKLKTFKRTIGVLFYCCVVSEFSIPLVHMSIKIHI